MRLPTEKAYGIQMANTCNALALKGVDVTLLTAHHTNTVAEDFFDYYKLDRSRFQLRYFNIPNIFERTRFGFWLHLMLFSVVSLSTIIGRGYKVLYSREPFPLLFLAFGPYTTVYEMHDFPVSHHRTQAFLCRKVSRLVVTNEWAKTQCVERYGIAPEKILVTPNGFDADSFKNPLTIEEARQNLSFPRDKKIIMYSGHLYGWKGVDVILQLAKEMRAVQFVFVGGTSEAQHELQERYGVQPNVLFIPHQPPHLIPQYLQAADVLVLPNIPVNQHSEFSTSPIKLFEYMAARRPVVASRLPSITSVVNDEQVFFAEPGNVADWKRVIEGVIMDQSRTEEKVERAVIRSGSFTWLSKAEKIMHHVQ
jgi:glycosyltransferase involved in cell wall biosynthesis